LVLKKEVKTFKFVTATIAYLSSFYLFFCLGYLIKELIIDVQVAVIQQLLGDLTLLLLLHPKLKKQSKRTDEAYGTGRLCSVPTVFFVVKAYVG
jgi:hypothetical protein